MFWKGKNRIGLIILVAVLIFASGCGTMGGDSEEQLLKEADYLLAINDTKVSEEQARLLLCNYRNIFGKAYELDLYETAGVEFEDYIREMTINEMARIISMDYLAAERGFSLTEEEQEDLDEAYELESISRMPARVKCAELAWRTLDGMI